ncbi:MAG: hypothetical protein II943_12225 [Victivallales bacterium]|nr:hypothetical protein [Victivallales bacterium]
MERTHLKSDCPSPEQLGEWLMDGNRPEIAAHVENCANCQNIMDGYRKVDELSKECFRPDPGFVQRIQAGCAREAERAEADQLLQSLFPPQDDQPPRSSAAFNWGRYLGMAATLIVVALLSALLTARFLTPGPEMQSELASANAVAPALVPQPLVYAPAPNSNRTFVASSAQAPRQADFPEQIASASHAGFSLADSRRLQLNRRTSSQSAMDDVAMVSNDGAEMRSNTGLRPVVLLPAEIEHVWLADNSTSFQKHIRQIQQEHPEEITEVSGPDELGIMTLRLHTNDLGVQYLVDALYKQGKWTLLSANYPQPGRDFEVAFREQPTDYTLKILTAEATPDE